MEPSPLSFAPNPTIQELEQREFGAIQNGKKTRRIWMLLPVYNEGQAIIDLIHRTVETSDAINGDLTMVIVDDGSSDEAPAEIARLANIFPIQLLTNNPNRGLGKTMARGMNYILELAKADDVIVTMDGDNTHPPESIPKMLELIDLGNDVVIASRFQRGATIEGLESSREYLSQVGRYLFRIFAPMKNVKDYTCGFRAFRASALHRAAALWGERFMTETGFTVTADILLKLRLLKVDCAEIPLTLQYQNKTSPSKMKVVKTTLQTLTLLLRHQFQRI